MFPSMTASSLAPAGASALGQATHPITVNGDPVDVRAGATVADLLVQLGLPSQKIAVERNLEIVPRSVYGQTGLCAGDQIEIVHFIGGG